MPNPTNDHVTLTLDRASRMDVTVRIHSAEGRMVRSLRWPTGVVRLDLDLSELAPALYTVEVRLSSGTVQGRLVVH